MASICPCPKGLPTLEVGPVKSTNCPTGISLDMTFLDSKNPKINICIFF